MTRVACLGECMVELREQPDGTLHRGYGGDTLNTAVYLARLGVSVDYVTALGDDAWSDEMAAGWRAEGIGTDLVFRLRGSLPGLYLIQTDSLGERRFSYWRDSAAARQLFTCLNADALAAFDLVYVSGITFSIFDDISRERLFAQLAAVQSRGGRVAFDTNFRPRGWPDRTRAEEIYERMFAQADIILASEEDLNLLFGADSGEARLHRFAAGREIVLKRGEPRSEIRVGDKRIDVVADPVDRVIDTTAAGDSFAAAYLAARLGGAGPAEAARAGHALAGVVVGYPGALIPRGAMP